MSLEPRKIYPRPEFAKEIGSRPEVVARVAATRKAQDKAGKAIEKVAGF